MMLVISFLAMNNNAPDIETRLHSTITLSLQPMRPLIHHRPRRRISHHHRRLSITHPLPLTAREEPLLKSLSESAYISQSPQQTTERHIHSDWLWWHGSISSPCTTAIIVIRLISPSSRGIR